MKLLTILIFSMFLMGCAQFGALCGKMQPVSDNGDAMQAFYGCGVYTGKLMDNLVDGINSLGEEEVQ